MTFFECGIREKINQFRKKHKKVDSRIVNFVAKFDFVMVVLLYFREALFYGNRKISSYQVKDIKSYCKEKNFPYCCVEETKTREILVPPYFEKSKEKVVSKISPEIYIADLKDIIVTGGSAFLIGEHCCLYDLITFDTENRYDLSFESLLSIDKNRAIVAERIEKKEDLIEEGIYLLGVASYNYYHLTIEILSRLAYVDRYEEYRKIPLIVDEVIGKTKQYSELLERINEYHHPVIYVESRKRIFVKRLIYPSYNTWMPTNIKKHGMMRAEDFLISNSSILNIRNCILSQCNNGKTIDKKIFISRKNSDNKRLINEDEIIKRFVEHGFEIVYPEELNFQQQIELFSTTKCFAGTTGAAFTNIIYTAKEAHVICIIPSEFEFYLYSTIAHLLNQKCIFLHAEVINSGTSLSEDSFWLDQEYCERFLQQLSGIED